jgi:adenosylcobinamide-GDP ribazoletransferase
LAGDGSEVVAGRAGVAIGCFPLAGLILGLVLVLVNRVIAPYLSTEILAVVLLTILILATGGHHLAGTQETFNSLAKKNSRSNPSDHWHVHGLLAVLLVILFKVYSIEVIGESRAFSLLLSPLLARWSLVLFLFGSTAATDDAARRITENVRSWHLTVATVISVGLATFIAGVQALWVALCLSLFALLARGYLHRREGGISLANCGALIELSETLSFTLFASL